MAEQDVKEDQTDELDGISEDDAKRLLDKPDDKPAENNDDPEGADQLGDAGRKALDSIKEQRRAAREERDKVKAELAKVQEELRKHSDKDKSDVDRLTEERDRLKAELGTVSSSVKRRDAAEEYAPDHVTAAQIRAVAKRLTGNTDDELKADAEELYALIAPAPPTTPVAGRPRERLRGGGDPSTTPDETDPRKLAALIRRPI